ncbi:MAG: hypothetical protein LC796_16940 [Acidobacteria bacterium]|nr:hypothetical protein [Acidobacteriota bacterium]MCA1610510.1 hypothetical protein [Acidobacteriota bacterium]
MTRLLIPWDSDAPGSGLERRPSRGERQEEIQGFCGQAAVPTLDSRGLIALSLILAAIPVFVIRRMGSQSSLTGRRARRREA